jgi:phage terminase small subunit
MPVLKNSRRERFAQLIATGKTATEAYQLAGYKPSRFNAATLARKSEIGERIAQINSVAAERAAVTVEALIAECDEAMALARELRNPTAMVAAIKEKGVLSGKRIERRESGSPGEFEWIENASAEELERFIEGEPDISAAKH